MTDLSNTSLPLEAPDFTPVPEGFTEDSILLTLLTNSHLLREGLSVLLAPWLKAHFITNQHQFGNQPKGQPEPINSGDLIVLLDYNLGNEKLLEWLHYWRNRPLPARVIVLETANEPEIILNYIEAGASSFTLQGASAAEVAETIKAVRQGRAHCSPEITAYLFARLAAKPNLPPPVIQLTTREQEVLQYITADYSNQQIAEALVIELLTVKHHVHNILTKLKVAHRHEAARLAREQGWLIKK